MINSQLHLFTESTLYEKCYFSVKFTDISFYLKTQHNVTPVKNQHATLWHMSANSNSVCVILKKVIYSTFKYHQSVTPINESFVQYWSTATASQQQKPPLFFMLNNKI